ncbi:DUF6404 family protein [Falsiruegeria mediterranea]|uniref:Uncharacterized protein n=1 Tax=Falsiruegeria mediterranea M17 TaxID=1200281 RepID=A0A2R8CBB8_9RHOB|nr:DUF6404 family protein [Falsiruegeria mediterranea]SPJ29666.1 hypothetical protein TRM7615_03187 [Falsiruegeria mediterranea M17]
MKTPYQQKLDRSQQELRVRGAERHARLPWLFRLFQKLGFEPIPPLYRSFLRNFVGTAAYFSPVWGGLMYFAAWRYTGLHPHIMIATSLFAGVLFGLMMAGYFYMKQRKLNLTAWDRL